MHVCCAQIHNDMKLLGKTLEDLVIVLYHKPSHPRALQLYGEILWWTRAKNFIVGRNYREAMNDLLTYLNTVDSGDLDAWMLLGSVQESLGDHNDACESYKRAYEHCYDVFSYDVISKNYRCATQAKDISRFLRISIFLGCFYTMLLLLVMVLPCCCFCRKIKRD